MVFWLVDRVFGVVVWMFRVVARVFIMVSSLF